MSSTSHSWKARHVQWLLPKGLMGKRRKNRPALQWRELLNIPSAGRPRSTSPVKSHVGWWDENGTPPRWISPQIHHFSQITRKTSDKSQLWTLCKKLSQPRGPKETWLLKVIWCPEKNPGKEKEHQGKLKQWVLLKIKYQHWYTCCDKCTRLV